MEIMSVCGLIFTKIVKKTYLNSNTNSSPNICLKHTVLVSRDFYYLYSKLKR